MQILSEFLLNCKVTKILPHNEYVFGESLHFFVVDIEIVLQFMPDGGVGCLSLLNNGGGV